MTYAREFSRLTSTGEAWQKIKQSATVVPESAPAQEKHAWWGSISRPFRRPDPLTPEVLRKRLDVHDLIVQRVIRRAVLNTVSFAGMTLAAQSNAHFRASILNYDVSDLAETGPHMSYKRTAENEERKCNEIKARLQQLSDFRQELPFESPQIPDLLPSETVLFLGAAELYGMARADFAPVDMMAFIRNCGVARINSRTEAFLANDHYVIRSLTDEPGPEHALDNLGVTVSEAMLIANMPTRDVLLGAAFRIADTHGEQS